MACLEPLDSKKKTVLLSHSLYDNKSSYILSRLIWDCVNEETKDPWRSAYQLCDSILKKQNPKIDLYIDVQEAVEILSHSLERLRKDPICAPFTQVTPATNLSREISVSDNLKKLVDILHKIHNIKQHVANRTGSLETTIQASIPIPKVIAHLVAQYLEPTFQIEPIPSPARYYRDPFGESLEGIEAEHIVSGVRSAYRYHTLTNKMLCNISHALEKKLFSPWFRRYTSVKFLGTLAFGTYLTLEVWVFRPLLCCLVFVAVAAEKIYQLFSCLIKAAVSSQNRRNNLKCCAVALPLLITNILYIFLATLTGLFQLISGGLTTQPIMRSIKLYTRSIE